MILFDFEMQIDVSDNSLTNRAFEFDIIHWQLVEF